MALNPVRADLYSPMFGKVFAASVAAVLHDADAPAIIKHLPCGVIFHNAGNFIWKDAAGTTLTTVVPATACGLYIPIGPSQLDVTNAVAVTVFWNAEP